MLAPVDNPLLGPWTAPYGLPPFDRIRPEHFPPAFDVSMRAHRDAVAAIAGDRSPPTFDNTVAALDRAGRAQARLEHVFHTLTSSATSPELEAVEREIAPRLAAHRQAILTDAGLYARLDELHSRRDALGLDAGSRMLVERFHLDFTLAGAKLDETSRRRVAAIVERLAALNTAFRQNVRHDEETRGLLLRDEAQLAGLPAELRASAREAAIDRGEPDAWFVTMSRSAVVPFLSHADRRDLRERAFRMWTSRGEHGGEHDNRPVAREILSLRRELARLHGHRTYGDYALGDRMARTPGAVAGLLERVWRPAREKALAERDALADHARALGATHPIEPWDWRYYAEKVRHERYAYDEDEVRPYFPLERMTEAMFDCAGRLFGLAFVPRAGLPVWHPDVRAYEVRRGGRVVGLFMADNFLRQGKRSGAWMSYLREQSNSDGEVLPVILNNNNFVEAPAGEPTLLSADDVRTLFHEFGHGLHGLLSNTAWERLSGTNVLQDFVELPSQLYERWAFEPSVLAKHARHARTGEPIPAALVERMNAARRFNQGFETVEYVASALVDMALHSAEGGDVDIGTFEQNELARIGMPGEIVMRHRLPHFEHVFAGSWYAAGYYVYLWAEVLEADGWDAFVEAGDVFDRATAGRLERYVYSAGGTLAPDAAYRAFRGRDPVVEPMLADRGLVATPGR